MPAARLSATVIDAEVRSCVPSESLRAQTVERLNALAAARPNPEQVAWGEMFDKELAAKRGVVIDAHLLRDAQVFEKQARWNRGTKFVTLWHAEPKDERFFVAEPQGDCAGFATGSHAVLSVTGTLGTWPPYGIAELLGLRVAAPLPADSAALLAAQSAR